MTGWFRRFSDRLTNLGLSAGKARRLADHIGDHPGMANVAVAVQERLLEPAPRRRAADAADEPSPAELARRAAKLFARGPREGREPRQGPRA